MNLVFEVPIQCPKNLSRIKRKMHSLSIFSFKQVENKEEGIIAIILEDEEDMDTALLVSVKDMKIVCVCYELLEEFAIHSDLITEEKFNQLIIRDHD